MIITFVCAGKREVMPSCLIPPHSHCNKQQEGVFAERLSSNMTIPCLVHTVPGKYMEAGAKSRTTDVVTSLMGLAAKSATLLTINPVTGEDRVRVRPH